ncbi:anti-lipopolysaccharide factor-like [Oratosquilla oratoria]|uniref:anti-lipopolysaccharide factor-like n=1 Tax=Oratosquilla oratoria TaxID=337810 RepID=UPI003F75E8CB
MKHHAFLGLLVSFAVLAPQVQLNEAFSLGGFKPFLTSQVQSLFRSGDFEFLGHFCFYEVNPSFYRWELYYKGIVTCPGLSNIRGRSKTRSRSGVINDAMDNYIEQALARNILTQEDVREYRGY